MSLLPFLNQLWRSGRVEVSPDQDALGSEESAIRRFLQQLEASSRPALAFHAPTFREDAALWGALRLYRGAQFLVYREAEAKLIEFELKKSCAASGTAAELAYSVDFSFRFLGDLLFLAQKNQGRQELIKPLQDLASRWPLSSVGIPELKISPELPFLESACLKQLYVDRIIERRDFSRLEHKDVRDSIQSAIGAYPELCPEMAKALETHSQALKEPS